MMPSSSDPRRRRMVRLITTIAIPLIALIAMGSWAISSPVGSSPDDDFHLASIWCAQGERPLLCEDGTAASTRIVAKDLVVDALCYARNPLLSAACQGDDFGDRPDDTLQTDRGNFAGLYPPVFYWVMGLFATPNIDLSVIAMRLANTAVFVGMVTTLYLLLPRRLKLVSAWSSVVSIVPLGMFIVPSTNPSSWSVISAATLWIALMGWFETSGKRKWALGLIAVIATVIGAGSRADSAVYAGLAIAVAVFLSIQLTRRFFLGAILPIALLAVAIIFYLSASQASATATGLEPANPTGPGDKFRTLLIYNLLNAPDLWVGVFGRWGLGWLDTLPPAIVWVLGFGAFCGALVLGLGTSSVRKVLSLAVVFAALVVVPTVVLVQTGAVVGAFVQPRYILPLIVLMAAIALYRHPNSTSSPLTLSQSVVAVAALGSANAISLHLNLRRYVTGTDSDGLNLSNGVEWWWVQATTPMAVWIIGTLSFGFVVAALCWRAMSGGRAYNGTRPSTVPDRSPVDELAPAQNSQY